MNWFMWVWICGAIAYIIMNVLLVFSILAGQKIKFCKPDNWGIFVANVLKVLFMGAIPFLNILFAVCMLFAFEQTVKKTREQMKNK